MSVLPVYGFVEGDTLGLLILANPTGTVEELLRLVVQSASLRVGLPPDARLRHDGCVLDAAANVVEAGIQALDRVDVVGGLP